MTAEAEDGVPGTLLRETPLHGLHLRLGARMVPFAGFAMPLQYPTGIVREHLHTRAAASLFDVSHMGQLQIRPVSGGVAAAARALEAAMPADVVALAPGRQRYAVLTGDDGGIVDDLMVARHGDDLTAVVNASRQDVDAARLRALLAPACAVDLLPGRALVAVQGPDRKSVV